MQSHEISGYSPSARIRQRFVRLTALKAKLLQVKSSAIVIRSVSSLNLPENVAVRTLSSSYFFSGRRRLLELVGVGCDVVVWRGVGVAVHGTDFPSLILHKLLIQISAISGLKIQMFPREVAVWNLRFSSWPCPAETLFIEAPFFTETIRRRAKIGSGPGSSQRPTTS